MAKLAGVRIISNCEIECGGARYKETGRAAQEGDILRCDGEFSFLTKGAYYLAREDESGVYALDDNDRRDREVDYEYTVFRRVESAPQTPQSPAEIRAAIERKRAEIAELEAQIAINVDDYVRVVGRTYDEDFNVGGIARVTHYDGPDYDHPFKLRSVVGDVTDWANAEDIEKISASEAKAAIIAQIEEAFKEARTSA